MDTSEDVSKHIVSYMKDKKKVVSFSKDSSEITLLNIENGRVLRYGLDEEEAG